MEEQFFFDCFVFAVAQIFLQKLVFEFEGTELCIDICLFACLYGSRCLLFDFRIDVRVRS